MKAFWKRRIDDWSAWDIDQNELPEALRKEHMICFKGRVINLIERTRVQQLKDGLFKVPKRFEEIKWPWEYSALMYAARIGGVKVATLFLEIQKAPETDYKGRSFTDFLQQHCPEFIP